MKEVLLEAEHRQCARNIYANFRKKFPRAQFENIFWRASKATSEEHFNAAVKEIQELNLAAFVHLIERDPRTWSLAIFKVHQACESVENGYFESFNSVIMDSRKKPIISMLEDIRIYVMQRMVKMQVKDQGLDRLNICPEMRDKLNLLKTKQRCVTKFSIK